MKNTLVLLLLLISSLILSTQFLFIEQSSIVKEKDFSEKVNLALRDVGHQLLLISGNLNQQIPPVIINDNSFTLKLEAILNYDTLPYLLDEALHDFNINASYRVMVRQCQKDTIILGYTRQSYKNETVACMGRELLSECNNIEVVFDQEKKAAGFPFRLLLGSLGILGILSFVWLYFFKKPASIELLQSEADPKIIALGTLKFNHENLTVQSANKSKKLTYRENKLLYTFASQPNQVLTREQLLEDVWGDEGVMVGRSLDVFVSRLRKILSLDPNVQIKNVHGVGYRLET
jgi:hypothetical protein